MVLGVVLLVLGTLLHFQFKIPIGRLPGDILIKRENFTFYFPLTSGIIVSALLSLILFLIRKLGS